MNTTKYIQLEEEMEDYKAILAKATESIMDQDISKYPIFVAHQQEIEIGVSIVDSDKSGGLWSFNASTLEEFVAKQIIEMEKVNSFIDVYKDPSKFFCLFVLSELGANFIFLPREKSNIIS